MTIQSNFENQLKENGIPINHQEVEGGHHLYLLNFQAEELENVRGEIFIQAIHPNLDTKNSDVQIIYRNIHNLNDPKQAPQALETINQLNADKTGYYYLYLAPDGEIYMRTLMRTGEDTTPLFEALMYGANIASNIKQDLNQTLTTKRGM